MVRHMEVMSISDSTLYARSYVCTKTTDNTYKRSIAQFVETCEFNNRTASADDLRTQEENTNKNTTSLVSGLI